MGSRLRTCACCKRQWREKPSGQPMIDPHIGSRVSNVTTKPPLPRVGRRIRPRHGDGVRRIKNKMKNRRKYTLSPGAYSDANITSDSEFDILFSEDDDGSLRDHPIACGIPNGDNRFKIFGRHSYSTPDLGSLIVEAQVNENRRTRSTSVTPNVARSLRRTEENNPKKARKYMIPSASSSVEGTMASSNFGSQNSNRMFSRHSYSACDLQSALLLEMQLNSLPRRSASVTPNSSGHGFGEFKWPKCQAQPVSSNDTVQNYFQKATQSSMVHRFEEPRNSKVHLQPRNGPLPPAHPVHGFGSSNNSFYDNRHRGSLDDSVVPHGRGNRKRNRNLTRNSYSVSDLTSPSLQMHVEEGLMSKSASVGQGLGELDWLKFQTGTGSSSQDVGYVDHSQLPHRKRKKVNRHKANRNKKALQSANNGETDYWYDSFDDSVYSNDTGSRNRYAMFSRNSQSANDLGSVLLEMHLDDSVRNRSKSLTPNPSLGYNSQEEKWSKSQSYKPSPSHSPTEKNKSVHHPETENYKKHLPPLIPTKDTDTSSHIMRADTCSMCSERMDARSLDGSTYTEMEVDGIVETVKRKAEDDVRCMRLLQSELEAERNAATIAANHAMNMITRLQQEKASLQMEALQYLRMMEEQAEYDMEALQKANELVEEKENEIQDLLDELEQYRMRYGDISMASINVPVIIFENEKRYILESLSTLEKKLHELSNGGDHLNDDNSFLTPKDSAVPNGLFDKSQEIDLATVEHELLEIKEKIEGFQADIELVKHACNSLHANEGLDFIQEITHQLQDLRRIMLDKRCISSN
ncbi:hypothetical protein L2E82_20092 [Cichorium intybus]|uniref:Uncharacterized protein n=1 Tax=Cichorium intybus TaxID=13427 RepID=A0ACB9DSQ2_CICIN|nr:hypothetical protein L2E82_20092 [Cichorium intybus]